MNREKMTLAIAHRGYSEAYFENTLPAFRAAITAGADYIETDVRMCRDGTVVCCHDATLERVSGRRLNLPDLDFSDLRKVVLPGGLTVPALGQVLSLASGRVRVLLDVKVGTDAMMGQLMQELKRAEMEKNVVLGIRNIDSYDNLLDRARGIAVLGLVKSYDHVPEFLSRGAFAVRVWEEDLTSDLQQQIQGAGRKIWITGGLRSRGERPGQMRKERLARLVARGVDGIILNDPTLVGKMQSGLEFEKERAGDED